MTPPFKIFDKGYAPQHRSDAAQERGSLEDIALIAEKGPDTRKKRSIGGVVQDRFGTKNPGSLLRLLERFQIQLEIGDSELRETVLAAAEKVAGTAYRKVLLRKIESVVRRAE